MSVNPRWSSGRPPKGFEGLNARAKFSGSRLPRTRLMARKNFLLARKRALKELLDRTEVLQADGRPRE